MKLIFIYNATMNPVSLIGDFISEIMPQQEANCKLCDITFSVVFKKCIWKEYLASLPIPVEFFLKDQFKR
ncbi:MAG: hypothetical protein AAFV07_07950, partial [Bacteroidota bacterium]